MKNPVEDFLKKMVVLDVKIEIFRKYEKDVPKWISTFLRLVI